MSDFLTQYPRVDLAHLPTPLEPLRRLTEYLRGPELFIKRDDCTGLATGGNKTRKLEFLLGDALAEGCESVVTVGGLQSNHARQTAAAAARLGLGCELLLQEITGAPEGAYEYSANLLLNDLCGATVRRYPADADMAAELDAFIERLVAKGRKPYRIPLGGSSALGALGYVLAIEEILTQSIEQNMPITHIVVATGSGGTQAGLLAGLAAAGSPIQVIGINVSTSREKQTERVAAVLDDTCKLLGLPGVAADRIHCEDAYFEPGYGVPNEGMVQALRLLAQTEGLLLDPVYTGKAMAGLIDLVHQGRFEADDQVLFLHTGGSAGLFAYPRSL
ncbi:MAG: D-cysteine desulfhydrase [Pseudomonadota bacterium]